MNTKQSKEAFSYTFIITKFFNCMLNNQKMCLEKSCAKTKTIYAWKKKKKYLDRRHKRQTIKHRIWIIIYYQKNLKNAYFTCLINSLLGLIVAWRLKPKRTITYDQWIPTRKTRTYGSSLFRGILFTSKKK